MSVFYFDNSDIVTITSGDIERLKQAAQATPLRRARYCLHPDRADALHEMVIAFHRDSYVRPHKHKNKSESFHVIEGELLVVFFNEEGKTSRAIPMKQNGCFLYRLSHEVWHTVILLSEYAVIHEVTNGPFVKEDSLYPAWAPDGEDAKEARDFIEKVKRDISENGLDHVQ